MAWTKTGNIKGPTGLPAYTLSTSAFTVPAIGATVVVSVADTSWVAVGEIVYVQDANGVGAAGPLQVTAKTTTTLTLLNLAVSTGGGGTPSSGVMIWGEVPMGAINGINKSYTTAYSYAAGQLGVYLNGIRQHLSDDYIETSTSMFQLVIAPLTGDLLNIDYMKL